MALSPSIPCPTCGYDLRGLLAPRGAKCPECGDFCPRREIDKILTPRRYFNTGLLLIATPLVYVVASVLAIIVCGESLPGRLAALFGVAASFAWAFTVTLLALRRSKRHRGFGANVFLATLTATAILIFAATIIAIFLAFARLIS